VVFVLRVCGLSNRGSLLLDDALSDLGNPSLFEKGQRQRMAMPNVGTGTRRRARGKESTKALVRQLKSDPSEYERGYAALALGRARAESAVAPLLQALSDSSPWVRGWAAFALGQIQEPLSLPALCHALGDGKAWVREQAADALLCFDIELTHSILRQILKNGNAIARVWAIHVMAQGERPEAALDVLPSLEDSHRSIRLTTVRTLYRLGHPTAIAPLRTFMNDPDEHLRGAAAFGLGSLGDRESVPALCRALAVPKPWVRRNAARSLLELGEALQLVASMTRDSDTGVRCLAANARRRLPSRE